MKPLYHLKRSTPYPERVARNFAIEKRRQEILAAERAKVELPTDQIAAWTPEQWAEFERRIGIRTQ